MTVYIDFAVRKNCWNFYDSYGEICVGCGCCSSDPRQRALSRLAVCKRQLQEKIEFDDWMEGWEETQRKNVKADIACFRKMIRYYEKRLKELEGVKKDG